jgi:hypothetical protein
MQRRNQSVDRAHTADDSEDDALTEPESPLTDISDSQESEEPGNEDSGSEPEVPSMLEIIAPRAARVRRPMKSLPKRARSSIVVHDTTKTSEDVSAVNSLKS